MFNAKKTNQALKSQDLLQSQNHSQPDSDSIDASSLLEDKKIYPTVIGDGSCLEGNLHYQGTVYLDGQLTGNITADQVNIGISGLLTGEINAQVINISGKVIGRILGQKVTIKSTAIVKANIQYHQIELQLGADLIGDLKLV